MAGGMMSLLAYGMQEIRQLSPGSQAIVDAMWMLCNLCRTCGVAVRVANLEQDQEEDTNAMHNNVAEALLRCAEIPKLSAPMRATIVLRQWGLKLQRMPWWRERPESAQTAQTEVWARVGAHLAELRRAAEPRARAHLFAGLVLPLRRRNGLRFLATHVLDAPPVTAATGGRRKKDNVLLLELLRAPRRRDCDGARDVHDAARGVHEMLGLQDELDVAWCRARLIALRRQREAERRAVCAVLEVFGAAAAAADAFSVRERRRRERHWSEHANEHWLLPPPSHVV
jgi:hypothetical protein